MGGSGDRAAFFVLVDELDLELLNDRVGEHFVSDGLDFALSLLAGDALGQCDVEEFALAHIGDAVIAETVEGRTDGLPLGVEDSGLQRDKDAGFHGKLDYRMVQTAPHVQQHWI